MLPYHIPVLLREAVDGLNIKPDGLYLDLTFGGGGHSREIMSRLGPAGHLMGFDQDRDAKANCPDDGRFIFVNHNFRYLRHFMRYSGFTEADGIFADLGVSWHEFDEGERGFSFRFDAPLDMRMNREASLTAADVVATYDVDALTNLFRTFGELDNARRVAELLVKSREVKPIVRTSDLLSVVSPLVPKASEKRYLAQLFQALRMEVNGEIEVLGEMLSEAEKALRPGGRLVVLTYHSLEDRLVKNFIKAAGAGDDSQMIYGGTTQRFIQINRKVIVPSDEEILANPRARSAKLRIAEKI